MKTPNNWKNTLFRIVFGALAIIIGVSFGNRIYRDYESIVKGILGVTILILFVRIYIIVPNQNTVGKQPEGDLFKHFFSYPRILKFLFLFIFWVCVLSWAIREIVDMFYFFLRLFP